MKVTKWNEFLMFIFATLFASAPAMGLVRPDGINLNGRDLPPMHVILTFDDGLSAPITNPYDPENIGRSQTQAIGAFLFNRGIIGTFFQVGCHFNASNNPPQDPSSSLCIPKDTHPVATDYELLDQGHLIANHTWFHLPLTYITSDPKRMLSEVQMVQDLFDKFHLQPDGLKLIRGPGLAFDAKVAELLNGDPKLKELQGPFGIDTNAIGFWNGKYFLGDFDWYFKKQGSEDCAQFYFSQIKDNCAGRGCVVLIHDRSEQEITTDWGFKVTQRLVDLLGPGYRFVPPDAIPGIFGNMHLKTLTQWSSEFGDDDGIGPVILGKIKGGKKVSACKARTDHTVWCATPDETQLESPVLGRATLWVAINDPDWFAPPGMSDDMSYRFWLADLDGDGKDDLVYFTARGLWVGYSNGQNGFNQPQLLLIDSLYGKGLTLKDILMGARFGNFFSKTPAAKDLIVGHSSGVFISKNYQNNFSEPLFWSKGYSPTVDLDTFQIRDINEDGSDDVMVRDPQTGKILVALSGPYGFFGSNALSPFSSWMTLGGQFNSTPWNDLENGKTLKLIKIGDKLMLAGATTTGMAYSKAVLPLDKQKTQPYFHPGWRHLCNTCVTTLSDWHPERKASSIAWGDVDGSGNDSAVFTRASGLDIGLGSNN